MIAAPPRLVCNTIDLAALGDGLCVPVPVAVLPRARIAWLNERWWIERGWDVDRPKPRAVVTRWLLDRLAVSSCPPERAAALLHADRYGGSFGTRHGGSGRCGIADGFIAKGIGPTPLCPADVHGIHGDGRLSWAEAIRETVAAEIAADELPWGAVPVVALIATGEPADAGGPAILVRPTFVRPAHFERSIFFGTAGFPGSDQQRDAVRTRDCVVAAVSTPTAIGFPGLATMLERLGEQLGAMRAHRLWQGKFLSSNATIDGALVDFGSFRAVSSWRRFFGEPEEAFGDEQPYIDQAVRSLAASFAKYAPHAAIDRATLSAAVHAGMRAGFATAVRDALALSPDGAAQAVVLLDDYWQRQQRERLQVADSSNWYLPWLHDALVSRTVAERADHGVERALLHALRPTVAASSGGWWALARWTCPRRSFHYERTASTLARVAVTISRAPERTASIVAATIDALLSRTHRHWPRLPAGFIVKAQVRVGGDLALFGSDTDGPAALLRGPRGSAGHNAFGIVAPPEMPWITARLCCGPTAAAVTPFGATVLPPPRFHYPPPLQGT